jgi:isocitrate/isopropylmalate dehydrogenase
MLTLEKMEEMGIHTKDGLARCMNKEAFYFKMVKMSLSNKYFDQLGDALAEGKLDEAFDMAHALKGVIGSVAIAPLYDPMVKLTDQLRFREEADYPAIYAPIKKLRDDLLALAQD